jgi:phosphatidylinositol-4-phosphate 3-kinase
MSSYNRNTTAQRRAAVIDYERQFQEDLERAQALSLESLALEKFKLQKQQTQYGKNCTQENYNSQSTSSCVNSTTISNTAETDGPNNEKKV